jgi:hypothetical protein
MGIGILRLHACQVSACWGISLNLSLHSSIPDGEEKIKRIHPYELYHTTISVRPASYIVSYCRQSFSFFLELAGENQNFSFSSPFTASCLA